MAVRLLLLAAVIAPAAVHACILLQNGWQPKSLGQRTLEADVVLAAYTRATLKHRRSQAGTYSAEFLVLNVLKGEQHLADLFQKRRSHLESALSRRLVNVSNFGDKTMCYADVSPGETYILFLTMSEGHLSAKYDDIFGAAILYSREKEEVVLEAMGWRPWGEWSPCSGTCGGGIQQRRRLCNSPQKCSRDDGQQRTCNMFACTGTVDILDAAGLRRSRLRPVDRQTAYRVVPAGSWKAPIQELLPATFPWEFSLLVTARLTPSAGGYLMGVHHMGSLQFGLFLGDSISLVLFAKDNVRVSFVTSVADGKWHQVAFKVHQDRVTFYLDCREQGKLPIPDKVKPLSKKGILVVGSVGGRGQQDSNAFQGDVEQLLVTADPDAASKQCSGTTEPLASSSRGRNFREEMRRGPPSLGTQSDQFPLRGDIIDDEDFSFDESGSGFFGDDDGDEEDESDEHKPLQVKRIPLRPEKTDYSSDKEETEEERDREEDEDYDYKDDDDDDGDDNSNGDASEELEGSGAVPKYELGWSEWSPCSATCSWGRRTRTSYCLDNGLHLESCTQAGEQRSETEVCFLRICPTETTPTSKQGIERTISTISPVCSIMCENGGTCILPNRCICLPTYFGDKCQYERPKHTSCTVTCKNGGTCHPPSTCICQSGFFGPLCQYGCGQACPKGSQCQWTPSCRCPPGYIPPTCTALCKPTCRNGGTCVAPNKCRCKNGYIGKYCEKAICRQGCKNGGRCVAPDRCACRSGYTGQDCGSPLCEPSCQNGGHCVKPYFCHCPPLTKGSFCEKFTCQTVCLHGGQCIGPDKCSCTRGYNGDHCEQVYCPGGCQNGAKCGKSGKCVCPPGYQGLHCEVKSCKFVKVTEPFKRGYKQKVTTTEEVPCGAWGWKLCTKTKVHYKMVYKTFYRTAYHCDSESKNHPTPRSNG